jgi:hypothetical protein
MAIEAETRVSFHANVLLAAMGSVVGGAEECGILQRG